MNRYFNKAKKLKLSKITTATVLINLLTFLSPGVAKAVTKDIAYKKFITNKKQIIHIIEVNPKKFDIISAHASVLNKPKTQVALIAKHFNAIMGINGGFFRSDQFTRKSTPAGVLKIKNKWHGIAYKARGAIGWSNAKRRKNPDVSIDILQTKTKVKIAGKNYKINHFNPLGNYIQNAIFSYNFKDNLNGCNIKITNNKISGVYIEDEKLNSNEYLFTYHNKYICPFSQKIIGKKANVSVDVTPLKDKFNKHKWKKFDYIVGGSPVLIYRGKKILNYTKEKLPNNFVNYQHGRTAVGILKNKNWLFVVVEENLLLDIPGFTLAELASFMHDLGCYFAINLDGGSSTSLYIADNIISTASVDMHGDKKMQGTAKSLSKGINSVELNKFQIRPVTDAILVIPKN